MSINELELRIKELENMVDSFSKSHANLLNAVILLSKDFYKLCDELDDAIKS